MNKEYPYEMWNDDKEYIIDVLANVLSEGSRPDDQDRLNAATLLQNVIDFEKVYTN